MNRRSCLLGGAGMLACLCLGVLVIQLVPTGVSYANPPVVAEPNWDSAQTRALAQRACFDCHSNETTWPLYSRIAPIKWLVARDVEEGRQRLNFSEWGVARPGGEEGEGGETGEGREGRDPLDEMAEVIDRGAMPPASYLILHPSARLSDAEREQLKQGLLNSLQ